MKRAGCVFAISLWLAGPALATPKLHGYAIDKSQTSVSSIIRGVGVIGGVVYGCADPRQPLAKDRVALGLSCMDSSSNAAFSIDRTNEAFTAGAID